jgi:uracil-DNA glycosylase
LIYNKYTKIAVVISLLSSDMHESWRTRLQEEFLKDYFMQLNDFLSSELKQHIIYPGMKHIFAAFNATPFDAVKVVIIGQDPYHGAGQANGFSFSVNDGVKFPPSLKNIFKEVQSDCGCEIPLSGNLEKWALQGVLLLNATLTVRKDSPGSHQKKGWEVFTDKVITLISQEQENVVFMLWGNYAKAKSGLIDSEKHLILEAAHPSPLARGAFFGSKHFSQANAYLQQHGRTVIDWCLA